MSRKDFAVSVGTGTRTIADCDRYPVFENEIAFLFGESGIGKSLLAKAIDGLLPAGELEIKIDGHPYAKHLLSPWVKTVRQSGFFVFQEPSTHLNPLMTLEEQLAEGSLAGPGHGPIERLWMPGDKSVVEGLLKLYPKPHRPSGGEKQRILLAMAFKKIAALARSPLDLPSFFIFDEPTGSLDDPHRNLFLNLLFEQYQKRPMTILIITHDYSMIGEVYRSHKSLLPRVQFLELSRKSKGRVTVSDFSPKAYLDMVDGLEASPINDASAKAVLRVGSTLKIFGRQLEIFEDKNRTRPADLQIAKGEMVYLKAQSGEGKTTVAKCILGLFQPDAFSMELCGLRLTEKSSLKAWSEKIWGRRASMVFQHADEALNLEASVWDAFAGLPLPQHLDRKQLWETIQPYFDAQSANSFLDRRVGLLSGGEKQRLNILRSLLLGTDLVVLDEPLNGLDFENVRKVLALLQEKQRQGTAFLLISHNEEIFDRFVPKERVYYLSGR